MLGHAAINWTNDLPNPGACIQPCSCICALQLIKALEAARGNGTSMISLIMPPKDQVRPCMHVWHGIYNAWLSCNHCPPRSDTALSTLARLAAAIQSIPRGNGLATHGL